MQATVTCSTTNLYQQPVFEGKRLQKQDKHPKYFLSLKTLLWLEKEETSEIFYQLRLMVKYPIQAGCVKPVYLEVINLAATGKHHLAKSITKNKADRLLYQWPWCRLAYVPVYQTAP